MVCTQNETIGLRPFPRLMRNVRFDYDTPMFQTRSVYRNRFIRVLQLTQIHRVVYSLRNVVKLSN